MLTKNVKKGEIQIFKTSNGTDIKVKLEKESVWLDAHLIAALFNVNRPAIVKHILNIYRSKELQQISTCSILEQVATDGKMRMMKLYNLDIIISVGYRVNSKQATQFRQWATQRLKDYLVRGYVINEKRLKEKQMQVETLKTGIRILSRVIEDKSQTSGNETVRLFAKGLEILDDYDHEQLDANGKTKRKAKLPKTEEYLSLISNMRSDFSSDVFAKLKDKSFDSSISQIGQSFNKKELYPSLEEKAATLLYLIVKNHSFVDGNKRIGAACFLYFLDRNKLLIDKEKQLLLSNDALAALTLFVASSKPAEMESVKKLIVSILNRKNL